MQKRLLYDTNGNRKGNILLSKVFLLETEGAKISVWNKVGGGEGGGCISPIHKTLIKDFYNNQKGACR